MDGGDSVGNRGDELIAPSCPEDAWLAGLRAKDESPSPPRVALTMVTPLGNFRAAFRRERQQAGMRLVLIASATMQEGNADFG